ncbi:hypothetical protein BBJ28_00015533 [Nothophytophthora sp. Chile5]|nr:hypothetical protein BBJ28_00015533 [Nothophytophthora sp. Chile5]
MSSSGKRRRARNADDVDSDEEQKAHAPVELHDDATPPPRARERPAPRRKGFLENSRLTERDRRQVRYKERELLQAIKENANDLAKLTSSKFDSTTEELDEMYENVCYPREANLDAFNLDELNAAVAKQSQALGSSDLTKYDPLELIRSSREACADSSQSGDFDWDTLGAAAGACFRSVPDISFLYVDVFGLMDTEVVQKERKRARRVQEDVTAQEAQPSEYTNKKDRKDAQARRLEVLQTAMERERKKPLFDVVVNPKSFTQTVENLFDTSFLVRNGSMEIGVDQDTGLPYLENHEGQNDKDVPAQAQSIISITPAQWQQLAHLTQHEEPVLGHRS